jgi:hypothetical protein
VIGKALPYYVVVEQTVTHAKLPAIAQKALEGK